jgi:hypothetical protein
VEKTNYKWWIFHCHISFHYSLKGAVGKFVRLHPTIGFAMKRDMLVMTLGVPQFYLKSQFFEN